MVENERRDDRLDQGEKMSRKVNRVTPIGRSQPMNPPTISPIMIWVVNDGRYQVCGLGHQSF
jgi:hypothetical protein